MDWTLNDALALVRAIQPKSRDFGYHLTLGGGVLNTGKSKKDVDLYFLPLDNGKQKSDAPGLVKWLTKQWGDPEDIGANYGMEENSATPDISRARNPFWQSRAREAVREASLQENFASWVAGTNQRPQDTIPERPTFVPVPNNGSSWVSRYFAPDNTADLAPSYQEVLRYEPVTYASEVPAKRQAYLYKLKFVRENDSSRIDVFIL